MRRTLGAGLVLVAGVEILAAGRALPVAAAQDRQVPGAFRTAVTVVPVDVRVLDRNGRPLTDLTAADFSVLENGVPQQIVQFAPIGLDPAPAASLDAPPELLLSASPDTEARQRVFLILLGRGRLQTPFKAIDALIDFVGNLSPADYVGVVAFNRTTGFSRDRPRVEQLLQALRQQHGGIEALLEQYFSGLRAAYGRRDIPPSIQSDIDRVFADAGWPVRQLPPAAAGELPDVDADLRDLLAGGNPSNDFWDNFRASLKLQDDLLRLYTSIEHLRYVAGDKHLVFVTEQGLVTDDGNHGLRSAEDADSIAALASDARVALHTVQTGGVYARWGTDGFGRAIFLGPTAANLWAAGDARAMAARTGGTSTFYHWPREAMERVERVASFRYLLGYSPPTRDWNGEYRRIEVKVNRPGAVVLYRSGYYAHQQLVPYDRRRFIVHNRIDAAAGTRARLTDIPISFRSGLRRRDAVEAVIAIDVSQLQPAKAEAVVEAALFVYDGRGTIVGEQREQIRVAGREGPGPRSTRNEIDHRFIVNVTAVPRRVRVVVYDYDRDLLGAVSAEIR